MRRMHNENLDTMAYEDVLKFLVCTEILKPVRADKDRLNVLLNDDIINVILNGIHLQTQEFEVLDALLMGEETADIKLHRTLAADILGKCHTA